MLEKERKSKWSRQKNNKHTIAAFEITTYYLIHYSLYSVNSYTDNREAVELSQKQFYHRGFHLHVNVRLNIMFLAIKISSKFEIQPIEGLFSDNIA